ncbi:hypothetical protein B0H13DRAFT_1932428 [Mycena leptocephala]|nr:hypothetical protein B0H13DRAFT_1932428 [Mycena leptocephala]
MLRGRGRRQGIEYGDRGARQIGAATPPLTFCGKVRGDAMVAPRFTISTTVFSDSESEDDELLPRTEPMRHDSTVQRNHTPEPDYWSRMSRKILRILERHLEVTIGGFFCIREGHQLRQALDKPENRSPLNIWAEDDLEDSSTLHMSLFWSGVTDLKPAEWNGHFFVDATLRELGLRVSSDKRGEVCQEPFHGPRSRKRRRRRPALYCRHQCHPRGSAGLLHVRDSATSHHPAPARAPVPRDNTATVHSGYLPRPTKIPQTSFESKCSAYEFYNALARETDNTGSFQPRGVAAPPNAQMVGACAHTWGLGISRPAPVRALPGLSTAGQEPSRRRVEISATRKEISLRVFLAIDANFRMKRKQVSSEEADPGLNLGSAFFSEVKAYMQHVGEHWEEEQEKSRCVSHDAVNQPDKEAREQRRRDRHGGLYINMDYMLWKSLQGYDDLVQLVVSYDIVCQCASTFGVASRSTSPNFRNARTGERRYVWLIPKFHLPAHIEACNILYSFNLTPYVGRTDGEAPERGWANANPLAASTKEMGPGAGETRSLSSQASLPREREGVDHRMELWEADPKNPNPFVQDKHVSLQAVRGRIATETKDAVEGDAADDVRGISMQDDDPGAGEQASTEDRELDPDADGVPARRGRFAEAAAQARARAAMQPTSGAREAIELWLPSKQARTPGVTFKESHGRHEFNMREARAYEVLDELRRLLLVRTHHYKFKDVHVHGVGAQTRARTAIEVLDERIRRIAKEYRTRQALASLAPRSLRTSWELKLKPLESKDIRGMPRALFADQRRRRKKRARRRRAAEPPEMSWIWRTGMLSVIAAASTSEEAAMKAMVESLRVEWAKSGRGRIVEGAVVAADEGRSPGCHGGCGGEGGLQRVRERQAVIQETLKTRFERDWEYVPEWISLGRRGVVDFKTRADADDDDDEEEVETDPESYEPVPVLARNAAVVSASLVEGSLLPASYNLMSLGAKDRGWESPWACRRCQRRGGAYFPIWKSGQQKPLANNLKVTPNKSENRQLVVTLRHLPGVSWTHFRVDGFGFVGLSYSRSTTPALDRIPHALPVIPIVYTASLARRGDVPESMQRLLSAFLSQQAGIRAAWWQRRKGQIKVGLVTESYWSARNLAKSSLTIFEILSMQRRSRCRISHPPAVEALWAMNSNFRDQEFFGAFDVPEYLNCYSLNTEQNPELLDAKFMVSSAAFLATQIIRKNLVFTICIGSGSEIRDLNLLAGNKLAKSIRVWLSIELTAGGSYDLHKFEIGVLGRIAARACLGQHLPKFGEL